MVRAAVTVILGLYLVGLALAVAGNSASGSSALVRTIHRRLFSPWMTPPWLDLGYDTKLTYGLPDDADHRIEVRRQGSPATARPLVLPAGGMWGERARRWRRLARAAVIAEQDPDREALLPAAIGAGLFDDVGGEDLALRILRDVRPDRAEVAAAGETPPRSEQAYAARVRRVDGELQLIKNEPQEELAPVIREPTP
jgi:hypothetical protein